MRLLAFIAVVVAAAALNLHVQSESLQTTYENAISACESGNPVREAVVLATRAAAVNATAGNRAYASATHKILDAPYVDNTGQRNCQKAIRHP